MHGGLRGANINLLITLEGEHGPYPARLGSNWAYEADLAGADMIIGYPLLARFGLTVDTGGNCLRLLGSPEAPTEPRDIHAVKAPKSQAKEARSSSSTSQVSSFLGVAKEATSTCPVREAKVAETRVSPSAKEAEPPPSAKEAETPLLVPGRVVNCLTLGLRRLRTQP